jgi:hypothetical protein
LIQSRAITNRARWLGWRKKNLGASEIAALFGVHPFLTAYKLWALKSGLIEEDDDSLVKRRGRHFERTAIDILREENPKWSIHRGRRYYWDDETRLGATPDVDVDTLLDTTALGHGVGVIQIKTVGQWAWKKYWHNPEGEVVAPDWVAIQASQEAYFRGATWAAVFPLVWDVDVPLIQVPLKMHLIRTIERLAEDFWRRVRDNEPYPPDWGRDAALFLDLHRDDSGSTVDLSSDQVFAGLIKARQKLAAIEKRGREAAEERTPIDAQIVSRMGNAAVARWGKEVEQIVTAMTVKEAKIAYTRKAYRVVRPKGFVEEEGVENQ